MKRSTRSFSENTYFRVSLWLLFFFVVDLGLIGTRKLLAPLPHYFFVEEIG